MASPTRPQKVRKCLILGGGSAGFLAAITLKTRLPNLDVKVLHSSDIPIIGVGEGTTLTMPVFLHGYLGIDPQEFHKAVHPTWKLGIRFLWGEREQFHYSFTHQLDAFVKGMPKPNGFYAWEDFDFADLQGALMSADKAFERQKDGGPLIHTSAAYHLENVPFVRFLETHAQRIGVEIVDAKVEEVKHDESGVTGLELSTGETATADLYFDCSGFRSLLLGETLEEPWKDFSGSLFCDRAVAGGWKREEEPILPYTTAETMDAGWCWQIEHADLINRGYVYSSDYISDEEAEAEFRRKNPKVTDTRIVHFKSGRYERTWVKNVVALGNSAGFVEPLEATALAIISDHAAKVVHVLADTAFDPNETSRKYYNRYTERAWESVRRFLAMHYKFNTRLDTPFWRAAREKTDMTGTEEIVEYFQENGPSVLWAAEAMGPGDPFDWEGYIAMLVGMKVPHQNDWEISESESQRWNQHISNLRQRAENSMTMAEALEVVHSDGWSWKPDFYANAVRW